MSDEAFHEIQLNGKQLVFLFMAATVVAVVIFLCGVMVGRGVQVPRLAAASQAGIDASVDPTVTQTEPIVSTTTNSDAPLTAQETLTYAERLENTAPAAETLKPAVEAPAPPPVNETVAPVAAPAASAPPAVTANTRATAPAPAAAAPAASVPAAPVSASFSEPAGTGFVVQVAAVDKRAEAEIIARRLTAKGYPAFISTNGAGTFRVRVGKYPDRREAETISTRLEKEEQFKPWLTR